VEGGLAYIWEEEYETLSAEDDGSGTGDLTDNYLSIRFGQHYDYKLSETAMLWQSLEFLPRADDFENYLFNAEAGVEAALTAMLNLRFVLQDRYNSEPPPGLEKNDVAVITALVFKF
jgi:putative salt-induced outer membrane protein YdiY